MNDQGLAKFFTAWASLVFFPNNMEEYLSTGVNLAIGFIFGMFQFVAFLGLVVHAGTSKTFWLKTAIHKLAKTKVITWFIFLFSEYSMAIFFNFIRCTDSLNFSVHSSASTAQGNN